MRGEPITQPQLQLENPRRCFQCPGFISRGFSHIKKTINFVIVLFYFIYLSNKMNIR
jgi:hypothetical protein